MLLGLSLTTLGPSAQAQEDSAGSRAAAQVVIWPLPTLYPVRDGYRDSDVVEVEFGDPGVREARIDILDPAGAVLATATAATPESFTTELTLPWGGRYAGRVVAAGTYTVRASGIDESGTAVDVRAPWVVSGKRLQWQTWSKRVAPRRSLAAWVVGNCSRLTRIGARGLGLHSQTSCRNPEASLISTTYAATLPQSFDGRYRSARVDVVGGKRRNAPAGRRHYAVLTYLDTTGELTYRRELPARRARHRGILAAPGTVLRGEPDRPTVIWHLGLTAGSQYDVTDFVISIQRRVLA